MLSGLETTQFHSPDGDSSVPFAAVTSVCGLVQNNVSASGDWSPIILFELFA